MNPVTIFADLIGLTAWLVGCVSQPHVNLRMSGNPLCAL
jgi:hypothetical protein